MIVSWLFLLLGLALATFGARGFTKAGLPAGKEPLTGQPAQIVGTVFVLMGILIALAAVFALINDPSPPPAP